MHAGEMRPERVEQFRKLLEMTEQYRRNYVLPKYGVFYFLMVKL